MRFGFIKLIKTYIRESASVGEQSISMGTKRGIDYFFVMQMTKKSCLWNKVTVINRNI